MSVIGVDEAGRGPLFGRVYSGAVILPDESTGFDMSLIKDSKKFSSSKKIREVAKYIKENALYWNVGFCSEKLIDKKNIREATFCSMHEAIRGILAKIDPTTVTLHIDGNAFNPLLYYHNNAFIEIPHTCIIGGDNLDKSIAAASILAKVTRDDYIAELCDTYPELDERYDLRKNKGYGTLKHRIGIQTFGRSAWHHQSFQLKNELNI